MGYEIYNVVSGSMEPAIPVGSAAYVRPAPASQIVAGEVVAFMSGDSVILHRVTANDRAAGALTTKGDANEKEDFRKVPDADVIGRLEGHIPILGQVAALLASLAGKATLACFALCGVLLFVLAGRLEKQ